MPQFAIEFGLQRGDIFLMNNVWLLHNRSTFVDFDDPQQKRHLIRLWVNRKTI